MAGVAGGDAPPAVAEPDAQYCLTNAPPLHADASEAEAGVDTNSLDRFGCTGHWASSGCIRLLAVGVPPAAAPDVDGVGASGSSSGGLALMPQDAFAALWMRSSRGNGGSSHAGSSGAGSGGGGGGAGGATAGAVLGLPSGYHVPYLRLFPLLEAYGGLYRELKAAGIDLSRAHYMLRWVAGGGRGRGRPGVHRQLHSLHTYSAWPSAHAHAGATIPSPCGYSGWKTREGRPRLGASAPRPASAGAGAKKQRRGVVPADIATTRDLRALINWPGLLELLEVGASAASVWQGRRLPPCSSWRVLLGVDTSCTAVNQSVQHSAFTPARPVLPALIPCRNASRRRAWSRCPPTVFGIGWHDWGRASRCEPFTHALV